MRNRVEMTGESVPAKKGIRLMGVGGAVYADGFVRHIALAALDAVVNADLAHGTERLVIKSGNAERRAELFVELAQILKVRSQRGNLVAVVGDEKFLIAGV